MKKTSESIIDSRQSDNRAVELSVDPVSQREVELDISSGGQLPQGSLMNSGAGNTTEIQMDV